MTNKFHILRRFLFRTISLLFISFTLILLLANSFVYSTNIKKEVSDFGTIEEAELTVLVDNFENGSLLTQWGLSILAETKNFTVLFDTGPSPEILKNNSEVLGKDLSDIDCVVISHEHFDHTGGLPYVAEVKPNITVYVPENMVEIYKSSIRDQGFEVISISTTTRISEGICVTKGEYETNSFEQALVVNIERVGMVICVGCGHPGVTEILENAVEHIQFEPYLLIGGFHFTATQVTEAEALIDTLIDLGLEKIYPIHCSGELIRSVLNQTYPSYFPVEACVGSQFTISAEIVGTLLDPSKSTYFTVTTLIVLILIPIYKLRYKKRLENN